MKQQADLSILQVVGLTTKEYECLKNWNTAGIVNVLSQGNPLLVNSIYRECRTLNPEKYAALKEGARLEGSSSSLFYVQELEPTLLAGGSFCVEIVPEAIPIFLSALEGRIRLGKTFRFIGPSCTLNLLPGAQAEVAECEDGLQIIVSESLASEMKRVFSKNQNTYAFEALPKFTVKTLLR